MARKRFYITIEVEADVSNPRDKEKTSRALNHYLQNGMKRELDYSFYIQHDCVLSMMDEKGNQL